MRSNLVSPAHGDSETRVHIHRLVLGFVVILWIAFASPTAFAQAGATVRYHYMILSGAHTVMGEQKALIILVDFQDVHHVKSLQDIEGVAMSQLNAYYAEVSYGHISITEAVYGWYSLRHTMSYYGHDRRNPGDDDNLQALAPDALAMLPPSVDVTGFKYLVIVHAGEDQADDQYNVRSDEIWSQCFCSVFPNYEGVNPVSSKGKAFEDYAVLSELNGVGAFAHEWGHLFGLPDLYDAVTGGSYVGYWSLMDDGNRCCYNKTESTPSYIGGWGATLLGWLTPTVGDPNLPISSISLNPLGSPQATAMIIPISQSQYYFVEDRAKSGCDSHLPAAGVLVYLADESLNTGNGILRLINPKTGTLFPSEDHVDDLNGAVFEPADHFYDSSNGVYLNFLGTPGKIMALYTTQLLTAQILPTQLHALNTQITAAYNDKVATTVVLVDQTGAPITGQTIEVDLQDQGDWKQITSVTTNQTGGALIELDLKYNVGAYNVRVYYVGGPSCRAWFLPSSVSLSMNIAPAGMILSLSQPPITVTSSHATVTVTDVHGNPLAGASLTPYVNGKQLPTIITDSTGRASFTIQASQLGNQAVAVRAYLANYQSTIATGSTFALPVWLVVAIIMAVIAVLILLLRKQKNQT